MFSEKKRGGSAWQNEDLSKIPDDVLLEHYKRIQFGTSSTIKDREDPSRMNMTHKGEPMSDKAKKEFSQSIITSNFADLGKFRAEIERRGLKAPTMEEKGL